MTTPKILVVGSSGRLGRAILPELTTSFRVVLATTRPAPTDPQNAILEQFFLDSSSEKSADEGILRIFTVHSDISIVILLSGGGRLSEGDDHDALTQLFSRNVAFPLRCVEAIISSTLVRPIRFIFLSSRAVRFPSLNTPYATAKGALEIAFRGLTRQYASTNFSFALLRLGYVRTPDRYHEALRMNDFSQYIEEIATMWPNFSPIECSMVSESIVFISKLDPYSSNGLILDLTGA